MLSVFSTHIGGFQVVPAAVGDNAPAEVEPLEWKHVTDRWIPALCQLMQRHVDLPIVQREACRVLSLLCQQPLQQQQQQQQQPLQQQYQPEELVGLGMNVHNDRQTAIRENGGMHSLVKAMHTHKYNPDVQVMACRTLRILCHKHATNRDVAGQCGAINALVSALQNHVRIADVVAEGCTTLAALCFENTPNKNTLREEGGVTALVECMTTCSDHLNNANVHAAACLALWKCCFENSLNRDAIREAGGIPAILFAMKQFMSSNDQDPDSIKHNVEVQVQAMGALMNLSHQNNDNKATARAAGAFEAVLSAMKAFPQEMLVQKHGCGALNNLLGDGRSVGRGEPAHKIRQGLLSLQPERVLADAGTNFPKECGALVRSLLKKLA